MLTHASVTTMLPVIDMARARAFYEGSLGLQPGGFKPDGKFVYAVGGSTLALFPKPEGTRADHTAISFQVADIGASIAELKRAGSTTCACWARRRRPGSRTPKATTSACTKTWHRAPPPEDQRRHRSAM